MQLKTKFLIVLLVFLVLNIAVVSASDVNATDSSQADGNNTELIVTDYPDNIDDLNSSNDANNASAADEVKITKSTPKISVKTTKVKSKDTLSIYLKNSS